jgi:hypothetical protein
MASPFPGMNPYLEQRSVWEDFHQSLITEIREAIAAQVRPAFFVKIEERVFIHEPSSEERGRLLGKPDVSLFASREPALAVADTVPDRLAAIIATIPDVDIEKHSFIEIRDRQNRELVTMIEVLSPSHKRHGPDREQYLMKRSVLLCSPVSIVEIDLLRGGPRLPMAGVPACDPLPILPIPLKGEVPDAKLDLQALLNRVYDAAGYEDYIYESQPEPPLSDTDAAWSRDILANAPSEAMKDPG